MEDRARALGELLRDAPRVFAPLGWAFYGNWHYEETKRIKKRYERGSPIAEIDAAIAQMWNSQSLVLLRNAASPLRRFGRGVDLEFQRRCNERANLVDQAIACHQDKRYGASITLTLTQIDGLTREIVGPSFFKANPDITEPKYVDDETLAGIGKTLPVVRAVFSQPVDKWDGSRSLSRHGVIHGHDLEFATQVNSTKTIVLLGALIEHLEERAGAHARRGRRARDVAKSRLTGADVSGRLLDDRSFEEVYLFRVDFETRALSLMLQGGLAAESLVLLANERLRDNRLSQASFTLAELRDDRLMWYFRSPAGHYLGSSFHVTGLGTSQFTEERWTWDSSSPPGGGAWVDLAGWSRADTDPHTPNWRFEGFPML